MCYIKEIISVKILVICVINSSVIESALYGVIFTRCLCQKTSLAHTSLSHSGFDTNNWTREYNNVRRTFYDVNYMYSFAGFAICGLLISRRLIPASSLGSGIWGCSKGGWHYPLDKTEGNWCSSVIHRLKYWGHSCKKHTPPNTVVWPLKYKLHRAGLGTIAPAWFLVVLFLFQNL